jgi:single-strand DNA-binding protein
MASRSLNRVVLIGNLTRDPELKYTPQGTAVCSIGVATNRSWTTKTGETKEDVQFHRIVAWQKLAELAANLLVKGRKIYLEGRITYRSYEGKDGQQKQITEIVMDDFVLFDDRKKGTGDDAGDPSDDTHHAPAGHTAEAEPTVDIEESTHDEKVDPDDIPF